MSDQPQAIFFDMDGTILDWQLGMEESWLAACGRNCVGEMSPSQLHDAIRTRRSWFWDDAERAYRGRMDLDAASREIVRHAFRDLRIDAEDVACRLADEYRAMRAAEIAPYPGALETLRETRRRGIRTALITNGNAATQRRSVVQHALEQYFDCIVIEGEFGWGKPDERVFRHALQAVSCEPGQAWMIGDSLEADILTPHRLGMHTVWVDASGEGVPADAIVQPHRTIRSIALLL